MTDLPIYNNEKEAFDFLDKKYNSGVPEEIKISWSLIEQYANCCADVAGEGNSGEFHNEMDAKNAQKALEVSQINIINWFACKFGWKPVIAERCYNFYRIQKDKTMYGTYIMDFWKFEKL